MSETTLRRMKSKVELILNECFTEEQKRIVYQYQKDDAGSDLESFLGDDVELDEDLIWKLQYLIEDIRELEYLYDRSEKLERLENKISNTVGALKDIFKDFG